MFESKHCRIVRNSSILLPAILLIGCISAYVAPTEDEPVAVVSFEIDADPALGYVASFYFFEEDDERSCGSSVQRMALVNKGNPLVGKSTNTTNIPIPTGRTIIIRSRLVPHTVFGVGSCATDSFLVAEPGRNYVLRFAWLPNRCDIEFFDTTSAKEVPFRVRNEPAACR
mgnify:CR=1 FL=1